MAANWWCHTQNWEVSWGGVGIVPVYGKRCAGAAGAGSCGTQAAPRRVGLELAGLRLPLPACARSGAATGLSPSSHAPVAVAYQDTAANQPAGFFGRFRVSFHGCSVKAQDAGRLPSSQRLLPPSATLLAVYGSHLRCLQPHLPHFCHVSEPWLSGLGMDQAQGGWLRRSLSSWIGSDSPRDSPGTSLG